MIETLPVCETNLATGNLERGDVSFALLDVLDPGANLVNDTTELVAQDVVDLHLHNGAVVEVKVAAADGATGDLEDHVARLQDLGTRHVEHLHLVLALPCQGLHGVLWATGLLVTADVLLSHGAVIVADDLLNSIRQSRSSHFDV